jgi:hypothetical protein
MVNEFAKILSYCPNSCLNASVENPLLFYIFELANFSVLAFFVLIAYRMKLLSPISMWVWLALSFAPLLFNYFLISPWIFGDQFAYFHEITSLKTTGESVDYVERTKFLSENNISGVTFGAQILGLAPIPNFMTVTSAAFANKFFSLITFIWLSKYIDQHKLLFFFLLPSFIIYSSLGLRDNLIILTSMIALIHLANSRYIFGLIFLVPLIFLKIQMFIFLGIYFIGRLIFRAHESFRGMILLFSLALAIVVINQEFIITYLNYFRIGFIAENMSVNGTSGYAAWNRYGDAALHEQQSLFAISAMALFKLPYFLIMPLPWEWSNPFHIATFLDAILCLYALYYIVVKYPAAKNQEMIFLIACMGIGMLAYSFLMANVGTFSRYRFTLFLPYLLCIYYIASREHNRAAPSKLKK